jgi:tetratricopeptide (TPR) repeat protein
MYYYSENSNPIVRLGVLRKVLEGDGPNGELESFSRPDTSFLFRLLIMAEALKAEGNKAFSAKDYDRAIDLFSKAINLDQNNFVLWSNRSAAKAGKRDWDGALADAEQVCTLLVLFMSLEPTNN